MMKEYLEMEFPDWLLMNSQKIMQLSIQQTFIQYIPSARYCDRCWGDKLIWDYYLPAGESEGDPLVKK